MATQPQKKKSSAGAAIAAPDASTSPTANPAKSTSASPFPGIFNNPTGVGNIPFMAAPGFNMPPFGGPPMPGAMPPPQGMMPPMPGFGPMPSPSTSGELFNSLGNMLRLGIDTINTVLASSNQLLQGLTSGGYQAPYPYHPYPQPQHPQGCGRQGYGHMQHCCGHHQHNTYHDSGCHSCCDVYDESCCNPGVHNCC